MQIKFLKGLNTYKSRFIFPSWKYIDINSLILKARKYPNMKLYALGQSYFKIEELNLFCMKIIEPLKHIFNRKLKDLNEFP